jgi:hypothetical protein
MPRLEVLNHGEPTCVCFDDLMKYHAGVHRRRLAMLRPRTNDHGSLRVWVNCTGDSTLIKSGASRPD